MPSLEYTVVIYFSVSIVLSIVILFILRSQKQITNNVPTNWPVLGMIPGFVVNAHRLHDYMIEVARHTGGTFMWKGLSFAHMDMLFTTDPLDIHNILSKSFRNYPKGDDFHKIFDILGDGGIINSEGQLWEMNRKLTMCLLKHTRFQNLLTTIVWNKVENGLLPLLDSIWRHGAQMNLQDIFQRLTFDTTCTVIFDNDPQSLAVDLPHVACQKALLDVEEALLYRHLTPPCLWKLQEFLGVGKEKKFSIARKILDQFIYDCIARKQNEYNNMNVDDQDKNFTLLTALMRKINDQSGTGGNTTKILRDILLDLIVAGKDTTSSALSWFFYVLTQNSTVEHKILEEIHKHLEVKEGKIWDIKEIGKMVYLHGALCESLRLFPPVPFNLKVPLQPECLPSGQKVDRNTRIILPLYVMGRMKSIWGDDCLEFNPERWVSKGGGLKHEPSYKFMAFGSGPRSCVGKDMALSQLKIVSIAIIYHYHVELVEGHIVLPTNAIILHMKHGLKVRLTKRI
ncbi:hypothetical protein R6Q57_024617 [Mikania cordata]